MGNTPTLTSDFYVLIMTSFLRETKHTRRSVRAIWRPWRGKVSIVIMNVTCVPRKIKRQNDRPSTCEITTSSEHVQ